ncbi:hypothetical protein D9757_001864 [Collybiopsis confluens]|uniref:Vacuolar protein sorting 55 n=1 Tax=Collybiopsis confluens TaxID=2823264 RepID=A0A8H5HXN5_9AGAR|nr:hypothetical protein D9757_001864 [Collybiopsis confluens]
MAAGLKTVILLSVVLAVGFLLIILSCALWSNWLPLLVGASEYLVSAADKNLKRHLLAITFVIAPLPNALFSHCGADDFSPSYEPTGAVDLGRFLTSLIVITGFAFPIVLAHSGVINTSASAMSIVGGGLVYGTILAYSQAFKQEDSDFD